VRGHRDGDGDGQDEPGKSGECVTHVEVLR